MIKSKALEVNIADHSVDVIIDKKYSILQEVMSKYYGLAEGLNTFLKELSHPYKNWQFIVKETRNYCLNYFHLLKNHPRGPDTFRLYTDIFINAISSSGNMEVRIDAVDNFLLYLQKVIKESDTSMTTFKPVIDDAFDRIRNYQDGDFFLFIKSYYQIKKLAEGLGNYSPEAISDFTSLNLLLLKYYQQTYAYWLAEADPTAWFVKEAGEIENAEKLKQCFDNISHEQIRHFKSGLERIVQSGDMTSVDVLKKLLDLPGHNQFVEAYREIPQKLLDQGADNGQGYRWKLIFLFHIMNIAGLSMIHEETLREINRTMSWIIGNENYKKVQELIQKTFSILKARIEEFPATALNCVLNMGKGVYKTDKSDLVNFFVDALIDLGFQLPMVSGVGNDWQIKVNTAHILNIRTWLELIEINPTWSPRLLSYLIIHLSLCGVFIKDTDLFPRDITRFLNSDIGPVFNLAKQLARLFPVYFNDIGAEGQLRDISTRIDEITHRKDVLVHFLRKQSHVESSNLIIDFMEATLKFWETTDKRLLEPFVPPDIYAQIETKGPYIDGVHRITSYLDSKGILLPDGLITIKANEIKTLLEGISGVSEIDLERFELAVSFYKLLHQKYTLDFVEMDNYIAQLKAEAFPDLGRLKDALKETDLKKKIYWLLDYQEQLKELILSDRVYEVKEDIYQKRHFTVDIPSMYGSYHEMKFDALGLAFRIESLVNVLFEELVQNIDLSLITKATFFQIYDRLRLFDKALKLGGISLVEKERQLDLLAHSLKHKGFTFTQYLDIFKGFAQAVKNIINDYFNNIHEANLNRILSQIPNEQILSKYLPINGNFDHEKIKHRVSEIFFREQIALSLGLQQLDLFLSRILKTLFHQADKLPRNKLQLLLDYDLEQTITLIDQPIERITEIIHLGSKGLNMVKLKQYGLPVPPGFIITTEAFRYREIIDSYPPAKQNFNEQIARQIACLEKLTTQNFGDPKNPLILSVRSGSAISQPGMMDTFLNVGINAEIAAGIAARTGNPWFAWDSYRRFLQCYGMSFDLERDVFDAIISEFKRKAGIPYKKGFSGEEMKQVALTYKQLIQDSGIEVVEDPLGQLFMAIKKVFNSWESAKAKTYRKIMGISDDWGTAATVQQMVFGNISQYSGTGVFFTHNPRWSGDILKLWGDFTLENQGEDIVSGLVKTLPISVTQCEIEMRDTDVTLETHFPEIYNTIEEWAHELIYDRGWSPQEMEFTFESPYKKDLYLLQARDMSMRQRKKVLTFGLEEKNKERFLGHGIGVSGGAMNGRIVFSLGEIDHWKNQEPGTQLILVRGDTVPDDIREIYAADGLLTARGGVTSHAAVVAHQLGKTCVVGCGNLVCNEKEKTCLFDKIFLKSGEHISIDGREGSVYQGLVKIKEG
ncbi:MAG: pyruvate, phosphate dikinase [Proteobacteria bacterium]|nr:pyruvate, phosphate dikinase [Pseudomonadota bacterium]